MLSEPKCDGGAVQGARGARSGLDVLLEFLTHPRYEVIPMDGVDEEIGEHVPTSLKLTVTASPKRGVEGTLLLTEQLAKQGFCVVPHLAARLIVDDVHLGEILHRLDALGVRDVFVIAGDVSEPAGEFVDSASVLSAIAENGHHLDGIGIAGYPEGHPLISSDTLMTAMLQKAESATYAVSQISFDPQSIKLWLRNIHRRGIALPIHIGLPGVVDRHKLLRISMKIGVGESARFLAKHGTWFVRMFLPGGYSPDTLIEGVAAEVTHPASQIGGLHIYTFNELARTEKWRRETIARLGFALAQSA